MRFVFVLVSEMCTRESSKSNREPRAKVAFCALHLGPGRLKIRRVSFNNAFANQGGQNWLVATTFFSDAWTLRWHAVEFENLASEFSGFRRESLYGRRVPPGGWLEPSSLLLGVL